MFRRDVVIQLAGDIIAVAVIALVEGVTAGIAHKAGGAIAKPRIVNQARVRKPLDNGSRSRIGGIARGRQNIDLVYDAAAIQVCEDSIPRRSGKNRAILRQLLAQPEGLEIGIEK